MWQVPHKEEQRSLQPGSARGRPSQENSLQPGSARGRPFSRGARGDAPRKKTAFSRGARGDAPRKKTAFSRGARGLDGALGEFGCAGQRLDQVDPVHAWPPTEPICKWRLPRVTARTTLPASGQPRGRAHAALDARLSYNGSSDFSVATFQQACCLVATVIAQCRAGQRRLASSVRPERNQPLH